MFPQNKRWVVHSQNLREKRPKKTWIYLRVCAPGVSSLPGDADDVHEVGSTSAW